METNIETEYKLMLDEKTFFELVQAHPKAHTYAQTNYYFNSVQLRDKRYSLRLREKEGTYEMTLKKPTDGLGREEINISLSYEQFQSYLKDFSQANAITDMLKAEGFDLSLIKQNCSLTTIRHDVSMRYGMLSFDENHYNNITDYEMEFELTDLENGPKQFQELLDTYHLTYTENAAPKIKRVLDSLKL